jgi:hypothetical protein
MPIHDWTRVPGGAFHDFHQDWTIEIRRTLNRGLLPSGYSAVAEFRILGWEPDVVTIRGSGSSAPGGAGQAVADSPPRARQVARIESELAAYARKANRIAVKHDYGNVVAIIEVVSPGNKDSKNAIESFTEKAIEFLSNGVNLVVIDLFPPTPRDPNGIHQVIWKELTDEPFEPRPSDKPLTVASYDAWDGLTAYVNPVAVGDVLPDTPLFLGQGRHVDIPLEATYRASWAETPKVIRDRVEPTTA